MRTLLPGLCLLLLAGCSGSATVDGPVLTRSPGAGGHGTDAQVRGELVLDGPCLLLEQPEGRYPVIWPHGTRWKADERAVELDDGTLARLGSRVDGSGGYHQADVVAELAGDEVAAAAQQCVGPTGEIAVFNTGRQILVAHAAD